MSTKAINLAVFSLLVCALAGCGLGGEKGNVIKGAVVFSDAKIPTDAVDGAIVQFHPVDGDASEKYCATIWEGTYVICTGEGEDKILGAPEGEYVVTVSSLPSHPRPIPKKYTDPKTTDLKFTVEPGTNEFEIVLHP